MHADAGSIVLLFLGILGLVTALVIMLDLMEP